MSPIGNIILLSAEDLSDLTACVGGKKRKKKASHDFTEKERESEPEGQVSRTGVPRVGPGEAVALTAAGSNIIEKNDFQWIHDSKG